MHPKTRKSCRCFVDKLIRIINKRRNNEVQLADLQMENGNEVKFAGDPMTQSAVVIGALGHLGLSSRFVLALVVASLIAIAGCSKPDPLIVRCQKQVSDQLSGSFSFAEVSSTHIVLPGTSAQKIEVLNALKTKITDGRYKQLIDFHIPQVKKFGDNAGISNITIKFDLEFSAGGVQRPVGNCYYFWRRSGSSDPKTLAVLVEKR